MIGLVCAVALCAVLGFAGVRKILDIERSRDAMVALGVPASLVGFGGWALPAVEIAVGVALLPPPARFVAGICAAVLLGSFTVLLAVNLLRGRHPVCACFGAQSSKPISWYSVARNALLLALSGLVISGYDPHIAGRVAVLSVAVLVAVALAGTVAVLGWMVVHLGRSQASLVRRVRDLESLANPDLLVDSGPVGLTVGERLPEVTMHREGRAAGVGEHLEAGRNTLLLMVSDACGACRDLVARHLPGMRAQDRVAVELALVHQPSHTSATQTWFEPDVVARWRVQATPAAVLVGPDGTVLSELAYGAADISGVIDGQLAAA